MDRHEGLKVVMSHTGGALPYQSGRMDKNTKAAKLPKPASTYLKRMFTDTVSPHAPGMRFAIDYYGIDNVMYGTDYPCWEPAACLALLDELKLSEADKKKIAKGYVDAGLAAQDAGDYATALELPWFQYTIAKAYGADAPERLVALIRERGRWVDPGA